jgi:hypothetical protein
MDHMSHDLTATTGTASMINSAITQPIRRILSQEWRLRKGWLLALMVIVAATSTASAQVLTPAEIKDPELRSLQQQYINDLQVVGQDIQALPLKYRFYLSRKLDLDESQQQQLISARFDLIATTARPYWQ